MALTPRYFPLNFMSQYFNDKDTTLPLADGTLEFYRDTARSTPKTVYERVSSGGAYTYVALPNPVSVDMAGHAQNASGTNIVVYAYPYITDPTTGDLTLDAYYIVCKNSDGTTQWTREGVPELASSDDPTGDGETAGNQLSNAQFSEYFLQDDAVTLTVSTSNTVYPIAPDWDLVASGSGSIIIQRVPVAGNSAIPTYPSYYLSITTGTGVTNPFLRQRLLKNSGLWSDTPLSGFFAAKTGIGSNALSMVYSDSSGTTNDVTIFDAALTSDWSTYGGTVTIGNSSNTETGEDAYVDIKIELPLSNTTDITSVQVLVDGGLLSGDETEYDARSANREQAMMGDYYIPRLEFKNVPPLTKCWDFVENPRQFGDTGTVSAVTAEYIWDQTILQTGSGLSVVYSTNTKTNGLSLNHSNADSAYALIQYLDQEDAAKFIGTRLSVNINGYTVAGGSAAGNTTVKVRMFANEDATDFDTLPTTIITLGTDGSIALTSGAASDGWYEITRSNLPVATGTLVPLAADGDIAAAKDLGFNNWVISDDTQVGNGVQGVAVVVSFVPAASTTDYETQIDSISVVPGDLPCRPAPQSYDLTMIDAQRYYEQSHDGTDPQTFDNAVISRQVLEDTINSGKELYPGTFQIELNAEKRAAPTMSFYSPSTGTVDKVYATLNGWAGGVAQTASADATFSTNWSEDNLGTRRVSYIRLTQTAIVPNTSIGDSPEGYIRYQYVADSRIAQN